VEAADRETSTKGADQETEKPKRFASHVVLKLHGRHRLKVNMELSSRFNDVALQIH
jgi:hypothetical protein|tara:strand:- start:152 stop:319 length:168 start_codon:yes stop_codon:yes gene_type:complete